MDERRLRAIKLINDVLTNPLFNEMMDQMLGDIQRDLMATAPEARDKREELYQLYHMAERFRGILNKYAGEYTFSAKENRYG